MAGKNPESFRSFRSLVQLLLGYTVLPVGVAVGLSTGPKRDVYVVSGHKPLTPLQLSDGRFLRLSISLALIQTKDGPRVKVTTSNFQYQMDEEGDRWIFRYDYVRTPPDPHPSAHLHVRGTLLEQCLDTPKQSLEDIHFPTERVSLEAVIRVLIEQFRVPTIHGPEIWRPVLAESEAAFMRIAHKNLSGPSS